MKKQILTLTVAAALAASGYAAPFMAVGDNAEVFVTGQAGVRADSNIFLANRPKADAVFNFNPGLEFDFGKNSNTTGLVRFAEKLTSYSDHSDLNSNLITTGLNANYDDGKMKGALYVTYDEYYQNSVDVVNRDFLIRSNVFAAGSSGEVSVSEKSTVAAGVDYRDTDYRTVGFSDSKVVSLPVHYYYEVTPKVDLGLGYRYRASWFQYGNDAFDNFVSLAARGEFTPKLTGHVDVGWTHRNFSGAHDISLLGIDAGLQYAVTPKTSVGFNVNNDFDTNSQAQQQKNLTFGLQATSVISSEWTVSAGLNYRQIDYYRDVNARTDDFWSGQLAATYTINQYVNITAAVSYAEYQSDISFNQFSGTVYSLSANFRF